MADFNLLDTSAFVQFLSERSNLIAEYSRINQEYDSIVRSLTEIWKGRGAEAFAEDAKSVKTNLVGIQDVLTTVCDTLADCLDIIEECDSNLGTANRNAIAD